MSEPICVRCGLLVIPDRDSPNYGGVAVTSIRTTLLSIKAGDHIHHGDICASLLKADLSALQRRVEEAERRLESKQASLDACKEANGAYANQLCEALNALRDLTEHYVAGVNSDDGGFWDPETEPQVIAARKALEGGR